MPPEPLKLFLIAGEPSGDRLGAALMAGLKELTDDAVVFEGLGGPLMQAEGLTSLFNIDELSIMGIAEVLPRVPQLLRRIRQTAEAVERSAPAVLITIDSPDFCLRVARRARKTRPDLRTIHYVAPSVWAWRPGRAKKMARVIDHVLALLPFEPPYMREAGMTCDFVGHPIVSVSQPPEQEIAAFRSEMELATGERLLTVLPGSRNGEVDRLGPVFRDAVEALPETKVIVPTLPHLATKIRALFPDARVLTGESDDAAATERRKLVAFAASDGALAASGTVSLELAAMATPMVIAYDANRLTRALVRRLARIDTATLVNLVTDTRAVPEFLFEACTPEQIRPAVEQMLTSGAPEQREAARQAMLALGRGQEPPGLRAARSVLSAIG